MRWKALLAVAFVAAVAADASAGERSSEAADAYDRGAKAYDDGDFARAAAELSRADALAPDAVTLELALKAALRADDPARGMDLSERADGRVPPVPKAVASLASQARARFAAHAGRVHVSCAQPCEARLDDAAVDPGKTSWATVGHHTVSLKRGERVDRVAVTVIADRTAEASPAAAGAVPPSPRTEQAESGASPIPFWIAAGVTVAAGAAAGISAVDTSSKHDAFTRDRSDASAASAGSSAQLRTNVLFGVTGAAALATLALGVFVVRW